MFDYVIIVNDNGELKTLTAREFDPFLNTRRERGDAQLADDLNEFLDKRELGARERDLAALIDEE